MDADSADAADRQKPRKKKGFLRACGLGYAWLGGGGRFAKSVERATSAKKHWVPEGSLAGDFRPGFPGILCRIRPPGQPSLGGGGSVAGAQR